MPWNVTGVRADARETARDAARRSGLSVGEWLNSIIDIATSAGVDVAVRAGGQQHTGQKSARPEAANVDAGGIAGINERLDDLSRQLEVLARANVAMVHAGAAGRTGGNFDAAISQFDERLDQLISDGRNAAREMDRRVNAVGHAYVSFAARSAAQSAPQPALQSAPPRAAQSAPHLAPQSAPQPAPQSVAAPQPALQPAPPPRVPASEAATIDQAVAEIAARQSALDADAAGPAAFGTGHLAGLEQQLRHITDQIETLRRPCGIEQAVAGLRADLAEIGRALTEAMPRRAIEALEAEMRALAERLDNGRQSGADGKILAAIERGLGEVRETLRQLTPAEHLVGFEQALKLLTEKIDLIAAAGQDPAQAPAALQQIEQAVAGLRDMATSVASGDALAQLAAEVRTLSAKLDIGFSANANADVLRNLDLRITAITDAIEQERRRDGPAVSPEFETMIKALSDKLERVQDTEISRGEKVVYGHLEDRIAKLVEKLDSSQGRLGHLEVIERGMAELLVHLEEMRGPRASAEPSMAPLGMFADKPPVAVLERGLADLKETQSIVHRRTQDSLEAVHDTLGAVVDRLAMIESDDRGDPHDWPGPSPGGPGKPSLHEGSGPSDDAAPPSGPFEGTRDAAPSIVPKPLPHVPQSRAPLDPSLPPDHPLEPGSGPPLTRVVGSPADRRAAFEAAVAPERPDTASSISGQTSNFIAAARRAAKAAVGEQPALYARQNGGMTAALAAQPKGWIWDRLKSVLVGISVVVIVLGAVRVVLNFMEDETAPADVSRPLTAPANDRSALPADAAPARDSVVPAPNSLPASPLAPDRQSSLQPFGLIGGVPIPPSGVIGLSTLPRSVVVPPGPDTAARSAANDITGSVRSPPPPAASVPPEVPAAAPALAAPGVVASASAGDLPTEISAGLRAAAAAGNPTAAYELAVRYAEGRGVPANLEEAARWFERAAKGGIALAEFRLGSLYEKGLGVKKDLMEARRLYLAAADKGNAKAMHNLAVLYAEGIDGKPDYKNAVLWFRKAADHDVSDSQYNLAVLYARGIGVEQNLPESYKWFTLAARQGDNEAAKKRDDVSARLDPQSLMAARLAVQTWVAEPQPEEATSVKAGEWDAPRGKPAVPFKSKLRAKISAVQKTLAIR